MGAVLFYRGHPYTVLAVADGHGSATYTHSDVGAHLAMQAVQSAAARFIPYVVELLEEQADEWRRAAQNEFKKHFGRWVCEAWEKLVLAHRDEREPSDDPLKPYGTTLASALLFEDIVFVGAIGDSVVYFLRRAHDGSVSTAFPEDTALIALQSHSLSSPTAYQKWDTMTCSLEELDMLLLGTDGFKDSLQDPEVAVKDMHDKATAPDGVRWLNEALPRQLARWSDDGVGDDISVVACVFSESPSQEEACQE